MELFRWFCAILSGGFDYIATMTRRCSNLFEVLLEEHPDCKEDFSRVLTENGLLMKVEEIVDSYVSQGEFPRVVLADDVLVHGRNLTTFLELFYDLILECFDAKRIAFDPESLRADFDRRVTLWIFAVNDVPILVRPEQQWEMRYEHIWSENTWHEFSNSVSCLIYERDIANTSFTLSAQIAKSKAAPARELSGWRTPIEPLRYRDDSQQRQFYLSKFAVRDVYPTVRSYVCGNTRYYTPHFFSPELDAAQADQIADILFPRLDRELAPDIALQFFDLHRRTKAFSKRRSAYCQLMQLLLSLVTLSVFLSDLYGKTSAFRFDSARIARNFGYVDDVEKILNALCAIQWSGDTLAELCNIFGGAAISFPTASATDRDLPEGVKRSMEDAVYAQALEHEKGARKMEKIYATGGECSIAELNKTGEKESSDFLSQVLNDFSDSSEDGPVILLMLSCLTQMLDRGDVSLKARAPDEGHRRSHLYCAIRNTEMSLAIMPRRISPYFMEFFHIAWLHWRNDDFPDRVSGYFAEMLYGLLRKPTEEADLRLTDAVEFAQMICKNRSIVGPMLNWRRVFPDDPLSRPD